MYLFLISLLISRFLLKTFYVPWTNVVFILCKILASPKILNSIRFYLDKSKNTFENKWLKFSLHELLKWCLTFYSFFLKRIKITLQLSISWFNPSFDCPLASIFLTPHILNISLKMIDSLQNFVISVLLYLHILKDFVFYLVKLIHFGSLSKRFISFWSLL